MDMIYIGYKIPNLVYNMLREINDKRVGGMKKKLYLCRLLNVKKLNK